MADPPRWLLLLGVAAAIAAVALVVVLHLTGTIGAGVHR